MLYFNWCYYSWNIASSTISGVCLCWRYKYFIKSQSDVQGLQHSLELIEKASSAKIKSGKKFCFKSRAMYKQKSSKTTRKYELGWSRFEILECFGFFYRRTWRVSWRRCVSDCLNGNTFCLSSLIRKEFWLLITWFPRLSGINWLCQLHHHHYYDSYKRLW